MNFSSCSVPGHGKYPANFDSCPICNPNAKRQAQRQLTTEEHIARMTDVEVRHIFQSIWWEQGNDTAKALCLAEYDKRIGMDNWPSHIAR